MDDTKAYPSTNAAESVGAIFLDISTALSWT
jgi:hypothetical protein